MTFRAAKTTALTSFCVFAAMLKLFMAIYLPATVLSFAGLDDGLFMRLGENMAGGDWLGRFGELTLMKGPIYPAFLAASSVTGLPITLTTGVVQLAGIAIVAWSVFRITASRTVAAVLFALLALYPMGYTPELTRIIRDQIYWPQTLVVFALFSVLFLAPPSRLRPALLLGAAAGATLGAAWLTREEGVWFLPGLAVLALGGLVLGLRDLLRLRRLACGVAAAAGLFATAHLGFMTLNRIAYGSFVGIDVKERNFVAALNALQSVEVGPRLAKIPVKTAAREAIAEVSPAFRPIAARLARGGQLDIYWRASCSMYPEGCGDLSGGLFIWALRNAMAIEGHYASPAAASLAYGRIASETEAACADGRLTCRDSVLSFMPPLTDDQWAEIPAALLKVARSIAFVGMPGGLEAPLPFAEANDTGEFYQSWAFLNHPVAAQPLNPGKATATGWYHDGKSEEWPAFEVRSAANGQVPVAVERTASPDLVSHFDDPNAARNRMSLSYTCPDVCTIVAKGAGRPELRIETGRSVSAGSDGAELYFDRISASFVAIAGRSPNDPLPLVANRLRLELSKLTHPVLAPFLGLGLLASLAALVGCVQRRTLQQVLVMAVAAWTLVATRVVILALIEVSAFPATSFLYTSPASYIAIVATMLSFSALFVWRRAPRARSPA